MLEENELSDMDDVAEQLEHGCDRVQRVHNCFINGAYATPHTMLYVASNTPRNAVVDQEDSVASISGTMDALRDRYLERFES